tara:strand:+ start:697 stop:4686 length:3990 start_codon:yes stop_codon:yes gene_type:complete
MANIIQQLEDLKEWSQDSARYERRLNFRGGQLVQPGPGRQGYAGDTAGFREDIITFKGKELPKGFTVDKANEFGIDRKTVNRIINELRPDIRKLPYPENKEAKRKRLVVEKRLKKNFLDNAEFIELHKNFDGSDLKFAEFLNENKFTTDRGGDFTESGVYARRERLGLETKTLPQSMSSYKTEAKELGIDIKGLDDQTIKTKVRFKRSGEIRKQKRLTDPDFSARETATRKAWEKANPEKIKAAHFKSKVKSYEKFGMIQAVKNPKEELWRGLFEDAKRYKEGRRLKIEGDYGRYVSRERFLNAEILDTKTGEKITFKNLENYINPKNTGKTYAQVIKPFDQKWFVNETPGLRTEINSKLIPNWTAASKDNFFEIQHNAGRFNDPFDVSLSNESLNLKESQVRTKFEKMWNASDNLSDKKKAFKFYKENLPNEILSKPAMVERSRHFGKEIPFEEQLRALKKEGVNLPRGIFKAYQNVGIGGNCKLKSVKKAEGGRIGFSKGGYDQCMNNAIQEHNKNLKSDDLSIRNSARAKQFNINKTKNMKSLLGAGVKGGKSLLKLGRSWGIELEPIFEGGFYEWGRRKGLTHDQAKEETFFWKMLDPSTKTGLLEGAEPLLEKELYTIRGDNEFLDVDNRPPMQDPEFGQVIGERKSVKRYVENEKALAAAYDKYNSLYSAYNKARTSGRGRKADPERAEQFMSASENLWEEIKGLEKQLNYDRDMYQAAVEKQQTEQGVRAIEYGEYGQGDTPELARRREEERYRLMNEKFPGYQKADMDQRLENWGVYIDPNLRGYKGRTVQRPEGLEYIGKPVLNPDAQRGWTYDDFSDYLKDQDKMDYFAENFRTEKAGGGIAGIRRPWAIPPESGPDPQGIIPRPGYQQGNRVNPFEETGNLPGGAYDTREYIESPLLKKENRGITTVEAPPKEDKRTFEEIIESVVGKAKDRPKHYKLDEKGDIIPFRAGPRARSGMGDQSMEPFNKVMAAVNVANLSKEKSDYFWNKFGIEFGLSGNELKSLKEGKKFLNKENIPLISLDEDALLSFTKGLNLPGNTAATIFAESNLGGDINASLELANKYFKTKITEDDVSWDIKPTFDVGKIDITSSVKGTDDIIEKIKLAVGNPNWSIEGELIKAQKRKETGGAPDRETQRIMEMLMADPMLWRWFGGSRGMMQMFGDTMTEEQKGDILKLSGSYTFDKGITINPNLKTDLLTHDTTYGLGINQGDFSANLDYDKGLTGSVAYGPVRVGSTGDGARLDFNKDMGNLNLKANVDTEGNWFIGPQWKWTWGGPEKTEPYYAEGKTLAELQEALQPKKLYARGGLASLNNYATKRTG